MFRAPYIYKAIKNIFSKPLTKRYPEEKVEVTDGYRGKIEFDANSCIGCGLCTRVCSPEAITKEVLKLEEGDQITMTFDLGSCTFCGMCSDFCMKNAIKLTNEYEMIYTRSSERIVKGTFFKKAPPKKVIPKVAEKKSAKEGEKKK